MRMSNFLRNRVWGFRLIEVSGFIVLLALALSVYLAKVGGGKDAQTIASLERQIRHERQQIRLLEAEVAHNEQPARIERLSDLLQLAPAEATREVAPDALIEIASEAKPVAPPAPQPQAPQ